MRRGDGTSRGPPLPDYRFGSRKGATGDQRASLQRVARGPLFVVGSRPPPQNRADVVAAFGLRRPLSPASPPAGTPRGGPRPLRGNASRARSNRLPSRRPRGDLSLARPPRAPLRGGRAGRARLRPPRLRPLRSVARSARARFLRRRDPAFAPGGPPSGRHRAPDPL